MDKKIVMCIKSTYFTSKQNVNLENHINTRGSILPVHFKVLKKFIKTIALIPITFSNMHSLYAAKDNLYNVMTFAGNGKAGYTDGTGTAASFSSPGNIIINNTTGDLYVADWNNYVIRKITPSGVVTTLAGVRGAAGNVNGSATVAKFSKTMRGIACDSLGNLYLADYSNNAIRKITPTGTVSTFAKISSVHGITVDSSNNVYVTSMANSSVYKINSNGFSSILAGGKKGYANGTRTNVRFNTPAAITANSSDVYVADYGNNLIRKIAASNGTVTTVAGGGSPGSTAAGSANGAGATATFKNPVGIYYDKSANLYVADQSNNLLRKITSADVVTTITSSKNDLRLNTPRDVVLDNAGAIYIADLGSHRILKLIPNYIGPDTIDIASTNNDYGTYESINLAGGTIKAGTNALTITNNVAVINNTTSTVNPGPGQYIVLAGNVSGSGALTISSGTFALTGTNPYSGTITINPSSQLQFGLGGPTGSVASSSIINNGSIQFGTSGITSCSANISGTGSLWKSISGTLTLTGTNTYTGPTTIDASPNKQTNAILIGDISKSVGVNIASTCAYDLNGVARTLTNPSGTGTIKSSGTPAALTINATVSSDFMGLIDNTINGLTLTGSGKFGLAKDQKYTGTTTINAGSWLQIAAGGSTGSVASANIINNGKISFTRSDPYTYAGVISGTGSLHQYKLNLLTLTGANTYTGTTLIDKGGTLIGDISKSVGVTINGTYDLNGTARILIDPGGSGTIQSSNKPEKLTITSKNGSIFSGKIADTINSLAVNGTGKLMLAGNNTYTGVTLIDQGGTLVGDISKSAGVTISGTYDLNGTPRTLTNPSGAGAIKSSGTPAALTINATVSSDFMGLIDNMINGLTLTGSGKFGFAKDQKYTGTTTINAGSWLQIAAGGSTGSVASVNIINNGKISFTRSDPYTYAGVISGTGSLQQYILSVLTLTGANTYTGATTIDAGGTLIGDISKSVGVTVNGTYDLNGTPRTLINLSGSGTIQSSNKPANLTLTLKQDSTFSGTLASTISGLSVNGPKTLILSGNNAYKGATIVNKGATLVGNINNSSGVTIAGTYDLKGMPLTLTNLSGNGTIQSTGGTAVILTLASSSPKNATAFSGALADTIDGLVKTGPGTLILSGKNNMKNSTVTTIEAGTLQIGSRSKTGSIASNSIVNNGRLSFNRSNGYTYSGVISGAGSLIQNGYGKTLLRGANTYVGSTIISSGILNIASGNNLGSGTIILNGGTLQANANLTLTHPITLTKESTIATSTYSVVASGNIAGTKNLNKRGQGTLTLTGTNTYTGRTTISAGTLQIGSGSTSGSIRSTRIVNNGNFAFNRSDTVTYPGIISGTGTFTKSGTGTVILSGANTYTGTTSIAGGKLQIGSGAATGNITSATIVNNATLAFNRSNAYTYTGVISGTGTLQQTGTGTLTLAGANTYTGATIIDAGRTLIGNIDSSIGVSIAGTYDLNGATRTLINPNGSGTIKSSNTNAALTLTSESDSTFAGTITNTISSLFINGSKTLTLSGIKTYTGAITIAKGSALIGDISKSTRITVNGDYDLNGTAQTLNNLTGDGNIKNLNKDKKEALIISYQTDSSFSGTIENNLNGVIKKGSGTLTLAEETSYIGEFFVSEGTLSLTKTSALSGIINLSEKATLSTNVTDESIFTNPISFNSTTMSDTPATIKVNKPTTFSGPITCNAPPDKAGRLIISGGHPVTLTGKHMGNFAIILSGEGTSVIIKGDANENTEIVTGSTWFLLNKDKNSTQNK